MRRIRQAVPGRLQLIAVCGAEQGAPLIVKAATGAAAAFAAGLCLATDRGPPRGMPRPDRFSAAEPAARAIYEVSARAGASGEEAA